MFNSLANPLITQSMNHVASIFSIASADHSYSLLALVKHPHMLLDALLHLDKTIYNLVDVYHNYCYLLIFLVIFCETGLVVTPFLPGDSLLFIAGSIASTGSLNIGILSLGVILAAFLGDNCNFMLGKQVGSRLFNNPTSKIFRRDLLQKTHNFYERYGGKTIVMARFIPLIRTFAPFVAGIGYMTYSKFIINSLLASMLWVFILMGGGYLFGHIPWIQSHLSLIILLIMLISILPAVNIVISKYKNRQSNNQLVSLNSVDRANNANNMKTQPYHGAIRSFVRRQGRITSAQQHAYQTLLTKYAICLSNGQQASKENARYLAGYFMNDNPIIMEIGSGMGDATWQLAYNNPHLNYIAIEVHTPGVGALLLKLKQSPLNNLKIINRDIMQVLTDEAVANESISGFHIFFPDPWPKKRHHKRRLVNSAFIALLQQKLIAKIGYVHLATDCGSYAKEMIIALSANDNFINIASTGDGYYLNDKLQYQRLVSKFAKRALMANKPIWDILFIKK